MNRSLLFCLIIFGFSFSSNAQYTIPDSAFAARLNFFVPNAMNGNVLDTTDADVLSLTSMSIFGAQIVELDGIRFFTGLQTLNCANNYLDTLPLLPPALIWLNAEENYLVQIDSFPSTLTRIFIWENQLTSLPMLPADLEWLTCYENDLVTLPAIPNGTTEIACGNNNLTGMPALPSSLERLLCAQNQLIGSLPALPAGLQTLHCDNNGLSALPALPSSLEILTCDDNSLSVLPALPQSLKNLKCASNSITILPTLPDSLLNLDCSQNALSGLSALPASLRQLTCHNNALTSLPTLPDSLIRLECEVNDLSSLPPLPSQLTFLYASYNPLMVLPALPDSLEQIYCGSNLLTSLPPLPEGLTSLNCDNNMLTSLPNVPNSLIWLLCNNNPITCLPVLPDTLFALQCTGTNINCLPNVPSNLDMLSSNLGFPLVVCNVNTAPCPIQQEAITGSVFYDDNGNGVLDMGELPFTNAMVSAQPGDHLTAPDAMGNYVLPIETGTFMLDGTDVLYHARTTSPANITLGTLQIDSLNNVGYQAIPGIYDLVTDLTVFPARPGFDNLITLHVTNIGTEATTAAVELTFDDDQDWVGSSTTPDAQVGNMATWSPMMAPGDIWVTTVTMNTATSVAIGTPLDIMATALPTMQDTTPANNSESWSGIVVGAIDPNDKTVEPSAMTSADIQAGTPLEYTIRFQNTGTYPAERVVITDTLSSDLEWNSMEFVSSSHYCTWYLNDGVLHFIFDPIFLPDSVSDEVNSHGFVKFSMKPNSGLLHGDQIENIANIYFDFNEPIITNASIFIVDNSVGIVELEDPGFEMYPNPTNGNVTIVSSENMKVVRVLQLDGRVVLEEQINNEQAYLELEHLSTGTYLVSILHENGSTASKLIMLH